MAGGIKAGNPYLKVRYKIVPYMPIPMPIHLIDITYFTFKYFAVAKILICIKSDKRKSQGT